MAPYVPKALLDQARDWEALHRWERKELGLALRRLGLTYTEIQSVIPVPNSTLSNWAQEVSLTNRQRTEILARSGPGVRKGIPVDTQWRRRAEIRSIREEARAFAQSHIDDAHFVAGVALYWGEGAKTRNYLDLANGDGRALRAFVSWVRTYLDEAAEFVLAIHLHEGNDEEAAMKYWREETRLPDVSFTKTFIKPRGTGHRKTISRTACAEFVREEPQITGTKSWYGSTSWPSITARYWMVLASILEGSLAQFGRAIDS